jgi:hypothetical protein
MVGLRESGKVHCASHGSSTLQLLAGRLSLCWALLAFPDSALSMGQPIGSLRRLTGLSLAGQAIGSLSQRSCLSLLSTHSKSNEVGFFPAGRHGGHHKCWSCIRAPIPLDQPLTDTPSQRVACAV